MESVLPETFRGVRSGRLGRGIEVRVALHLRSLEWDCVTNVERHLLPTAGTGLTFSGDERS